MNLRATDHPEFDAWRWNDYWVPLDVVIEFKRDVYQMALTELARFSSARTAAPQPLPALRHARCGTMTANERARAADTPCDGFRHSLPVGRRRLARLARLRRSTRLSRWISSGSSM